MTATTKAASSGGCPLSNQFAELQENKQSCGSCGHPTAEKLL